VLPVIAKAGFEISKLSKYHSARQDQKMRPVLVVFFDWQLALLFMTNDT
jgi:hypothetical protein